MRKPWNFIVMILLAATFLGAGYFFVQEDSGGEKDLNEMIEGEKKASLAKKPSADIYPGNSAGTGAKPPVSPAAPNQAEIRPPGMENALDEGTIEAAPVSPTQETPPSEEVLKFAVLGDTQRFKKDKPEGPFQKAVKNILAYSPEIVLAVGDLVDSCDSQSKCEKKLGDWKTILGDLAGKTYPAMGNHDRTGHEDSEKAWQNTFSLPENGPVGFSELAYSFDRGNSHFVVLNTEKPEFGAVNKIQRDWLEKDLEENKKDNLFVVFHQPAYPVSSKKNESLDKEEKERDALWKILKENKVTAIFSGHEHIASRKKIDGVYQFVFGNTDSFDHDLPKEGEAEWSHQGNHYGTVEVERKKITVKVHSVDGNVLDTFEFENGK